MRRAEALFQRKVRELGCIVCRLDLHTESRAEIHHMLRGNRRMGEMYVLGLCPSHHRVGLKDGIATSRHPWRKRFEDRYGTEAWLLEKTKELLI